MNPSTNDTKTFSLRTDDIEGAHPREYKQREIMPMDKLSEIDYDSKPFLKSKVNAMEIYHKNHPDTYNDLFSAFSDQREENTKNLYQKKNQEYATMDDYAGHFEKEKEMQKRLQEKYGGRLPDMDEPLRKQAPPPLSGPILPDPKSIDYKDVMGDQKARNSMQGFNEPGSLRNGQNAQPDSLDQLQKQVMNMQNQGQDLQNRAFQPEPIGARQYADNQGFPGSSSLTQAKIPVSQSVKNMR